ncbi:alcohol dehydrogenase catalytic domain-containing protein, partial [Klebsiella pneumoniae]|uniref:alcohol dehydrogenase catalytic domain-containing protein n=1 Tax=Klebsiella pneumoniae TaxID=573 RepID=UPI001F05AF16
VGPRTIDIVERPHPPVPPEGRTLLRVEVVGLCASDLHLYRDDLGPSHDGLFPLVQGHEFAAVVEAVDPAGSPFTIGDRVAVWPVTGCGRC